MEEFTGWGPDKKPTLIFILEDRNEWPEYMEQRFKRVIAYRLDKEAHQKQCVMEAFILKTWCKQNGIPLDMYRLIMTHLERPVPYEARLKTTIFNDDWNLILRTFYEQLTWVFVFRMLGHLILLYAFHVTIFGGDLFSLVRSDRWPSFPYEALKRIYSLITSVFMAFQPK